MILGITGKSGAGKHTAATFFEQRGWRVIDVDKVAHRLYRPYQRVWREVVDRFGQGILRKNDVIDRQKLKEIVFAVGEEGKQALKDLNAIVHPEVKRVVKDEVYFLSKKKANTVVVAALWDKLELFEVCEKVLLMTADEELTYDRIKKRDGVNLDVYRAYTMGQVDPNNADFTVKNEGSFQDLYKELNQIVTQL